MRVWLQNSIFLIITNSLLSCIKHVYAHWFWHFKKLCSINLIWFYDLPVLDDYPVLALLYGNCPFDSETEIFFAIIQICIYLIYSAYSVILLIKLCYQSKFLYSPYKTVWRTLITSFYKELIDSWTKWYIFISLAIYCLIFSIFHVIFKRH